MKPKDSVRPFDYTEQWFALRTRARSEKKVLKWLDDKGVTVEAALASVERQWSDRVKVVDEPLFPGYVFVHLAPRNFVEALNNPWAVNILRGSKGPSPLRPEEMEAIRVMVEGVSFTGERPIEMDYFVEGEAVRVTGGPFAGIEGTLLEDRGQPHVVIRIDALRVAKGVGVPRELLERVEGHG